MRARTVLIVLALAALVLLALLNWQEFTRPTTLNLGWRTATAPLGLLLLGLLGLTLLAAAIASAAGHARMLREQRDHAKALQAQRDLADKAEASRFTDLRQMLDSHLRESGRREAAAASELDRSMATTQRELRTQLEQLHRSLSTRLGELEARLDARLNDAATRNANRPAVVAAPAAERGRVDVPLGEPVTLTHQEPYVARVLRPDDSDRR